jgi:hypothetical protein
VNYFWNLRREYGQSMETYLSNMHQAKMRMKKEDPNTTIGDKAYAVRLVRKAGLNREEQQQVLSATNAEYDAKKIETALKRLFKNIAMSDKSRSAFRPRFGGKSSGKKGSYKGGAKSSSGKGSFRPFSGTYAAEQYDMTTADEEAYYQEEEGAEDEDDDEEDWYENLTGVAEEDDDDEEEDEELVEAMVAYQSAKHRLAKAKKAGQRGWNAKPFGQKGKGGGKGDSLADKKAKSRCADCGQIGHWHGDEVCEKVKKGEAQAFRGKKGAGKQKGGRDGYYVDAYTVDASGEPGAPSEPEGDWQMTPWPELDVTNIRTIFDDTATANEELQHGDQGGVVTAYLAMPVAKSKVTAKAVASTTAVKAGAKLMAKALAGLHHRRRHRSNRRFVRTKRLELGRTSTSRGRPAKRAASGWKPARRGLRRRRA